jgi:protein-tyrosine phosphatase
MGEALRWMEQALQAGEKIVVHCVGGLGRSGMAAAALLKARGVDADVAIEVVRTARSQRALETAIQKQFVRDFPVNALSRKDRSV